MNEALKTLEDGQVTVTYGWILIQESIWLNDMKYEYIMVYNKMCVISCASVCLCGIFVWINSRMIGGMGKGCRVQKKITC